MPWTIANTKIVTYLGISGTKTVNFWPLISLKQEVFWKAILKKKCLEYCFLQYTLFAFSQDGPTREFRGQPLKSSFPNISKNDKELKFWSCWSKSVWNHKTFLAISKKRNWPLKLGCKKGLKSFKLSKFCDNL